MQLHARLCLVQRYSGSVLTFVERESETSKIACDMAVGIWPS